jgi:hypothetical protein
VGAFQPFGVGAEALSQGPSLGEIILPQDPCYWVLTQGPAAGAVAQNVSLEAGAGLRAGAGARRPVHRGLRPTAALKRATARRIGWRSSGWPDFEWEDARIDMLDALGRGEEAQAARWSRFERFLSAPHRRAYLKRLPDFDDLEPLSRPLSSNRPAHLLSASCGSNGLELDCPLAIARLLGRSQAVRQRVLVP